MEENLSTTTPPPSLSVEEEFELFRMQLEQTPPGEDPLLDEYRREKGREAMGEVGLDPDQDSPSPWLLMRPDVAKKAVTAMKRGALNAWSNIFRFGASAVHHTRKALGLYGQEELQRQQEFYAQPFSQRQYSFPESWPVVGGFPITFSEDAKGIIAGPSHGPVYDILESLTEEGVEFLAAGGVSSVALKAPAAAAKVVGKAASKKLAPQFAAEATEATAKWIGGKAARLREMPLTAGALTGALSEAMFNDPMAERLSNFIAEAPPDISSPFLSWINAPIVKTAAGALAADPLDSYGLNQLKAILEDYLLGLGFASAGLIFGATMKKIGSAMKRGEITEEQALTLLQQAEKEYAEALQLSAKDKETLPAQVIETDDGMYQVVLKHSGVEPEEAGAKGIPGTVEPEVIPGPKFTNKVEADVAAGAVNKFHKDFEEAARPIGPEEMEAIRKRFAEVYNKGDPDPDVRGVVEILEEYGINKKYLMDPEDSIALIKAMVDVVPEPADTLRGKPVTWERTFRAAKALFPELRADKLEPVLKKLGVDLEKAPAVMAAAKAFMILQHREIKKLSLLLDKYPGNEAIEDMLLKGLNNLSVIHAEFVGANASVARALQINLADSTRLAEEFGPQYKKGRLSEIRGEAAAEPPKGGKDKKAKGKKGKKAEADEGPEPKPDADAPSPEDAALVPLGGGRKLTREEALDVARLIALNDTDDVDGIVRVLSGPTLKDIQNADPSVKPDLMQRFLGARVEFLLSSPKTQVINIVSNAMKMLSAPAELAWYGATRMDTEALHQSWDLFLGQILSTWDAVKFAAKAFNQGAPIIDPGNVVWEKASNYGLKSLREGFAESKPWGAIETLLRLPSRSMIATDEFFSQINYRARARMDIMANIRGRVQRGEIDATPEQISMLVDRLLKASVEEGSGRGIYKTGIDMAREGTYKTDLTGTAKRFQDFVNSHPVLKFFFPFLRAPANIFDHVWQSTPGLNLFNRRMQDAIAKGGVEGQRAVARAEMGASIFGLAAFLAASGQITGEGPRDPKARKEWMRMGNRPYSIKLADGTQIEYRRGDPFFSTLGILADFWTASGEIEEADKYGFAAAMISSIAANLLNKSYLSNVDTLIRAFAADNPEYAQQLLNSSAGSFVPSAAKDFSSDPYEREVRSVWEAIKARIPGYSESLEPRYNLFGEPVLRPEGFVNRAFNPFTVYKAPGKLEQELVKVGRAFPALPARVAGGNIDLTDREYFGQDSIGKPWGPPEGSTLGKSPYARWHELMGDLGDGSPTLREQLEELVLSGAWDALTDSDAYEPGGQKYQLVAKIVMARRDIAWHKLLEEYPRLRQAVDEEFEIQMEGLMGEEHARRRAKELRDLGKLIHRAQ